MGRSSSAISRAAASKRSISACCASNWARASRRRRSMRVIAGKHRGRKLLAPEGGEVRPTGERAREALFDILMHGRLSDGKPAYEDAQVLDAFAGTGAFGLEALSRGARFVSFIEQDRV